MADLSLWSAQALQSLSSDGHVEVMYFQSSQVVVQKVLHDLSTGSPPAKETFDPHGEGRTILGRRQEPLMDPKYHPEMYRSEPTPRQMNDTERSMTSPTENPAPLSALPISPKPISSFGARWQDLFEPMDKKKRENKPGEPQTKHDWAIYTIEDFLSKLSQHSDWLNILKAYAINVATTMKPDAGGSSGFDETFMGKLEY